LPLLLLSKFIPCIGRPLTFARKPFEVSKYSRNQFLPPRVLCSQRRRKEFEKISGFLGGVLPMRRRRGQQMGFQFVLPKAQCRFISLNFRQEPTKLGLLLSSHAAMLIEFDGPIGHDRAQFRSRDFPST
jgi:hypothetical protein